MGIKVHLDRMMLDRGISLTELAQKVGLTLANLSILKSNKARAVRFSTLEAICRHLHCQPGDLLEYVESGGLEVGPEAEAAAVGEAEAGEPGSKAGEREGAAGANSAPDAGTPGAGEEGAET